MTRQVYSFYADKGGWCYVAAEVGRKWTRFWSLGRKSGSRLTTKAFMERAEPVEPELAERFLAKLDARGE